MDTSWLTRLSALVASCSLLLVSLPSAAITLDSSSLTFRAEDNQCLSSPDVTFAGDSYYVAFVQSPCSGPGEHEVMIGRWNPSDRSRFDLISSGWAQNVAASQSPLVRVASAGNVIIVSVVDRGSMRNTIHTLQCDLNLMTCHREPMGITSSGTVMQHSFDCTTVRDGMPSCVLSTIETPRNSPGDAVMFSQAYAYFPGMAPRALIDLSQVANVRESPIAIASVAGPMEDRAVALLTRWGMGRNRLKLATASMRDPITLEVRSPVFPGVAAMVIGDQGAVFWTVGNSLHFVTGLMWSGINGSPRQATITPDMSTPDAGTLVIEDGVPIGKHALLVGRNGRTIALTSFATTSDSVSLMTTMVEPGSLTRLAAARGHCALMGTAVAVYTTQGSNGSSALVLQPLSCSEGSECVSPDGQNGTCSRGRCVFDAGMCDPDSDGGVDAGADAAFDGNGSNQPMDGGTLSDAIASSDASVQPDSASLPTITGGACTCRVGATSARNAWPLALGALGVLVTRTVRARRRSAH